MATRCEYGPCPLTSPVPFRLALRPSPVASPGSYVCSRSGHILEIDPQRLAVRRARYLLPAQTPSSPLPPKQAFSLGR